MKISLGKFIEYFSPAVFASQATYESYKTDLKKIIALSAIASFLEALALALIYRLIIIFTQKPVEPLFENSLVIGYLDSPLLITVSCALILSVAIKIKRESFEMINRVSQKSGVRAGELALIQAKRIITEGDTELPVKKAKALVFHLTKNFPFACGFATKSSAAIIIRLIHVLVLTVFLVYLSPLLTMLLLATSVVVISYLAISYETVVQSNLNRQQNMSHYRQEASDLAVGLTNRAQSEAEFANRIKVALTTGVSGRQLAAKLSERRERQSGSLSVEYVYPVAIIAISLMYTFLADLAPDISQLALYFLLTRQVVLSLFATGNVFMSLSTHHQTLADFSELIRDEKLPEQLTGEEMNELTE